MEGCNSCKHLSTGNKKPGRTGGYLYFCERYGSWINVYKDSACDSYEEALDRSTTERNAIYEDCKYYSDDSPSNSGCNSCAYLSVTNKKPGRTSGYLYYCTKNGTWINAYKDSACNLYAEAFDRNTAERNEIYESSKYYDDSFTGKGCNSCDYLDPKAKKPGKAGGCLYFCNNKKNYVNAAKDYCENYKEGYRDNIENNEIYNNSKNYDDDNTPLGSYLFILLLMIIIGIICFIFFK